MSLHDRNMLQNSNAKIIQLIDKQNLAKHLTSPIYRPSKKSKKGSGKLELIFS